MPQRDSLKSKRPQPESFQRPHGAQEHGRKKMYLWVLVSAVFIVVFGIWLVINPLDQQVSTDDGSAGSIKEGFDQLLETIRDFAGSSPLKEKAALSNEEQASDEFIKEVEQEVFPEFGG